MWKAHVFFILFSCLTIVRIMGFHDYGASGKLCVVNSFFFSGGKIQDGTLDIALWVNSKIAAICARSNYKLIYFLTEYRPIHDFGVDQTGFKVCPTQSMSEYCFASFSAQSWRYCNGRT